MLTQTARPQTFSEVAGQKIPKALLQAIIKSPKTSPKTIILGGAFGTGKTTQARIFARALNCENPKANGDPCMKCSHCLTKLDESPFYSEYDSSQLKLDNVRDLVEQWYSTLRDGWRVIVIDEAHLLSKQTQSALLKVMEDTPKNTFFVCCTTDLDKLLETIRSRALEIRLTTVPHDEVKENLKKVAEQNYITVDDEILERIIKVSKGHMRNAHMELEKYSMVGKVIYMELFKSSYDAIDKYFVSIAKKSKEDCFLAVEEILQNPLVNIKTDFDTYVLDMTRSLVTEPNEVVRLLGANTLKLVKLCLSDWFKECFESDIELQTGLLAIYQIMSESVMSNQKTQQTVVRTGARR